MGRMIMSRNGLNIDPIFLKKGIFIISDYTAIVIGLLLAYYGRLYLSILPVVSGFNIQSYYIFGVVPFIFLSTLVINCSYALDIPYWEKVRRIFSSITIGVIVAIVLMYTGHVTNQVSRIFVGLSYIFVLFFVGMFRYVIEWVLVRFNLLKIPILLIGAGKTAELVYHSLQHMPINYYTIIGYVDDSPKSDIIAQQFPCLGGFKDVEKVVREKNIRQVLICAPGLESKQLVSMVSRMQLLVKQVSFVPELFGIPTSNISVRGLMEEEAVIIQVQNNLAKRVNRMAKRVFDIVVTVLGGIVALPIIVGIAVLIYIDSPGPIIFPHRRVGQNGKEFLCYKFRTMVLNAQEVLQEYLKQNPEAEREWEQDFKLKDDPRITKIGHFLRRTSLDELPQLWNVLVGEMSLVGPRPIVQAEIEKYGEYINDFYLVPPGITGVWQVSGRSDTTYEERVHMDSWYVHNWSVWIDIVYLVKTVAVVIKSKGAY